MADDHLITDPTGASNEQNTGAQPATLASPAAPVPPHTEETSALKNDIEKILSDVKLPERRQPPEASPQAQRGIPTALGAPITPEKSAPAPQAPAETETPPEPRSPVTPIHTLKDDLKEVVHEKKISVVRAVSLEEERRHAKPVITEVAAPRKPNRLVAYLFAMILMLVLGGASLGGVYVVMQERLGGAPALPATPSILFAESAVILPLQNQSPLDLKRLIAGARQSNTATLGAITRIIPITSETGSEGELVEREATLKEFLAALGARAPAELVRALGSEFFFGVHTVDTNAPVFVIPVISYDRAFPGMLAWESTLNADFAPAFTFVPDQIFTPEGLPEKRKFQDIVMRNYDVRALRDDAGTILFYYSFPSQRILVIAESPYSFTEVLSRLQAQRAL